MANYGEMAVSGGIQGLLMGLNNLMSRQQSEYDREQNYELNEKTALMADRRTRALYEDYYSPKALLEQYKAAGLSPSMMFGGTPGQGGMSGAQSAGASGPSSTFMPLSLLESVQAANIAAQTEKTKAETKNIQKDTALKSLQEEWDTFRNQEKSVEFEITTTFLTDKEGNTTSLFELAQNCYDYDQFLNKTREDAKRSGKEELILMIGSELGQKTMRSIYMSANRFDRDIKILSEEGISADFQKGIMQALQKEGFAKQNAETAIAEMKAAAASAELTEQQKDAWNNILERLRKTNSTAADVAIVAAMILNQAASHWNIKTGK